MRNRSLTRTSYVRRLGVGVAILGWGFIAQAAEPEYKSHLLAHYAFDEGKGVKVHDSSPNKLDAALKGDPAPEKMWVEGVRGSGLKFSRTGGNTHLRLPDSDEWDLTDRFTISFWMKPEPDREAELADIVSKQCDGESGGAMYRSGYRVRMVGLDVALYLGFKDEVVVVGTKRRPLQYGVWRHVAVTFDGKAAKIHVNGEEAASREFEMERPLARNSYGVVVGAYVAPQYSRYTGLLDDLRIYDAALTPEQVMAAAAE